MPPSYADKPWTYRYPSFVPVELPVPRTSMIDIFEATAQRLPDGPAVHYFDRTMTFRDLNRLADGFAAQLEEWGIGRGDRLAVLTQNDPEFLIALYGAWKRGAIVVPLNPMFKEKEIVYHLNDSGAEVLVCLESLFDSYVQAAVQQTSVRHVVTTSQLLSDGVSPPIPSVGTREQKRGYDGPVDMVDAIGDRVAGPRTRQRVTPDDVALLVYTSGTTGLPKGAMELHRNLAFNARVYQTWVQLGEADGILGAAPLFHITGLVAGVATSAISGSPLILFHRFAPNEAFRAIERWRATFTVASITAYIALMNDANAANYDIATLTKCYSGGAPIPPATVERFEKLTHAYIHNVYGLSESNSPTHAVPYGSRAPVDPASGALSIGVPVPNCDAKIVGLDDPSEEVSVGEPGELAVRGPMIFSGYWQKPQATTNAFYDGWFLTGDVVVMDPEGWFYLVDRKKDMIIASGFKVWPREVEDTLYQHPAVREVAVVGVPDPYRGETVKAYVALREDARGVSEAELIDFCRARLAAYKYPRSVAFIDEVPKTATGKFLRRELRRLPEEDVTGE